MPRGLCAECSSHCDSEQPHRESTVSVLCSFGRCPDPDMSGVRDSEILHVRWRVLRCACSFPGLSSDTLWCASRCTC